MEEPSLSGANVIEPELERRIKNEGFEHAEVMDGLDDVEEVEK